MKLSRLAFLATVILPACTWVQELPLEEKEASLKRLAIQSVAGQAVAPFLRDRMADVVVGQELADVRWTKEGPRLLVFDAAPSLGFGFEFALGSAATVADDGYFLTAAHNVQGEKKIWVVSKSLTDRFFARARVVWRSDRWDLALLHADVRPEHSFRFAAEPPRVGQTVLLGGHRGANSAGRVEWVGQPRRGLVEIEHGAPVVKTDSGGPLVTTDGRLLGINHSWKTGILGRRYQVTAATGVSPAFLQALIAKDRAR